MTHQPAIFDESGLAEAPDFPTGIPADSRPVDLGVAPRVIIRRSARRRRTLAARREGDAILVMVPDQMDPQSEQRQVDALVGKLLARENRDHHGTGPVDLTRRARALARQYIEPRVGYALGLDSVRWVGNQQHRWASCTPASGQIRVSDRMIGFPPWVIDHVLIHELCHLVHANHGPAFRALAGCLPRAQEADGFLLGWSWATQRTHDQNSLDDDLAED
ncbi:M48 family metallopeptidase [Acidipropionibacterium jensenii]|uniref:M48 metallopeptidase family protein n=1 Tax=Acidipropionibacterium jensenii TaxID=1749 RepID=UPI000BC34042|nr:M48 family metallopeptidase [Acidipropionibacterium jensenii]